MVACCLRIRFLFDFFLVGTSLTGWQMTLKLRKPTLGCAFRTFKMSVLKQFNCIELAIVTSLSENCRRIEEWLLDNTKWSLTSLETHGETVGLVHWLFFWPCDARPEERTPVNKLLLSFFFLLLLHLKVKVCFIFLKAEDYEGWFHISSKIYFLNGCIKPFQRRWSWILRRPSAEFHH